MPTFFKLNKAVSPYHCGDSIGVRVRIDCDASEGLSSKIFAYLPDGRFNHVCNVIDMKACPEDTPAKGRWPKWYRLSYVDIVVPRVDMAYDFVEKVEEDVEDLYRMMKRYNQLISESEVIIPKGTVIETVVPSSNDNQQDEDGNDGET